ncbi:hypothetical protein M9Y10_019867 [Tritrichomonas musculus]|uniref:Protein kinase domain-containing protein n=1 Tax=Tritrichomonas musculus TaxID=1915356 RepID=A0ABR2HJP0_9EUKA
MGDAKQLSHPAILKYIGYCSNNFYNEPKPVIISQFMPNRSLEEALYKPKNLSTLSHWNDTIKFINIFGIASAMSHLHSHNIIHGYLYPNNILLNYHMFPKVSDFQPFNFHGSTQNTIDTKTVIYTAPELCGNSNYSKEGDVYAFGMIMYEILTNEKPFKNLNFFEVLTKVATGNRPSINATIMDSYSKLIQKCWSQNPSDRPTFDDIVKMLRNDSLFMTDSTDRQECENYIEYIDEYQIIYEKTGKCLSFEDFVPSRLKMFEREDQTKQAETETQSNSSGQFDFTAKNNRNKLMDLFELDNKQSESNDKKIPEIKDGHNETNNQTILFDLINQDNKNKQNKIEILFELDDKNKQDKSSDNNSQSNHSKSDSQTILFDLFELENQSKENESDKSPKVKSQTKKSESEMQSNFISCPMTPQQNSSCKSIFLSNSEDLLKHINIRKIVKNNLKACDHPLLIKKQILSNSSDLINFSGKMIVLDKMLSNPQRKNKIIIISQINEMLDIISEYLITKKYKFDKFDSNIRGQKRQHLIDVFNDKNNDLFILLLDANSGLKGINFSAANTIIVYDADFEKINDIYFGSAEIYYLVSEKSCEQMKIKLSFDAFNKGVKINEEENEKILRYGAYYAFNSQEKELRNKVNETIESEIGRIIAKSRKLMEIEEDSIYLNNPNFWFNYLPTKMYNSYYNPEDLFFAKFSKEKLFVDKTKMINIINENFFEKDKRYLCVSRPRRFGKSYAAQMLCAYYSKGNDNKEIFQNLEVAQNPSWKNNINKYNVIFMDILQMVCKVKSQFSSGEQINIVHYIQSLVLNEIINVFPFIDIKNETLSSALEKIHNKTGQKFVIIIDEWDYILNNFPNNQVLLNDYATFIESMFKGIQTTNYISLAYLTGILPIKCHNLLSSYNNFLEFSMFTPYPFEECFGFTQDEVKKLCAGKSQNFESVEKFYDGYIFNGIHIFNPNSVICSIICNNCQSYWSRTGSYEKLADYINLNFDGLQDTIIQLLSESHYPLISSQYKSNINDFVDKEDVLIYLVHIGYLAYDNTSNKVFIPNLELFLEFDRAIRSIKNQNWANVIYALNRSEKLLDDTINGREKEVAEGIDKVHTDNVSILSYNNELSLSCVISLAYYSAIKYYSIIREFPLGKGFADVTFLPRKNVNQPAILIELKWNKSEFGAIKQIESKKYHGSLSNITDNDVILVGINYNKNDKTYTCQIRKYDFNTKTIKLFEKYSSQS